MNKNTQKVLLLTVLALVAPLEGGQRSHSYLSLPTPFQSCTPEREGAAHASRSECKSFLQVVPLWGKSYNPESIPPFFFSKSTLLVAEDKAAHITTRDLCANHFNIQTEDDTFKSTLFLEGSHKFYGAGLTYRQHLSPFWWLEISAPILHVENILTINENRIDKGGGALKTDEDGKPITGLDNAPFLDSMVDAFKQPSWRYGKIDSGKKMVENGVGDVEIKLGYESDLEHVHLNGYVGVICPTGNVPEGKYVFEPIVGNGGHVGIMYGSLTAFNIWSRCEHEVFFMLDFNSTYLFSNRQMRSFDLKDKELSRYIALYKNAEQAEEAAAATPGLSYSGTSGINMLTQKVKVSPGFSGAFITAARYVYRRFEAEIGYSFFGRQAESIDLDWLEESAVKDAEGLGYTNKARTMNENFGNSKIDPTDYAPLLGSAIDVNSAATQALLTYTLYATLGYYVREGDKPILLGLGASYDLSGRSGINQLTVWGTFALSF